MITSDFRDLSLGGGGFMKLLILGNYCRGTRPYKTWHYIVTESIGVNMIPFYTLLQYQQQKVRSVSNNTSDSFRYSRVSETFAGYMLDYFFNV